MIDNTVIKKRLENFEFKGYPNAIRKLLSAFGIIEPTIAKIVGKIENGEYGPFYVYRRAAIFCVDDEDYESRIGSIKTALPLVLVFQLSRIVIINQYKGTSICEYSEIINNLDALSPLQSWDINKNDHYSTLELDTLVESLYRELKLSDNEEEITRNFIFSLLYIAHFRTLMELKPVSDSLKGYDTSDDAKLARVFNYFFDKRCPFIKECSPCLVITKEAYKYIFAIIQFDTNLIDAEYLTSLIYRMTNRDEAGLYGHQTSFVNVEKLLQPLFLNEMQKKAYNSTNENVFEVVTEIYETVVFDPTNSPGCYLVSAYNGLMQQLRDIEERFDIKCQKPLSISNFVGLVKNNLTEDLTKLALTYTHTQELKRLGTLDMDALIELYQELNVHVGDELKADWHDYVFPNEHLYIVGSPDFKGSNRLPIREKEKMQEIFSSTTLYSADYCSTWLIKSAQFINGTAAKAAFVLTNSVSQGEQSTFILNKINENGCEYIYAYRSFKWNTSNDNSGVTVVIIGIAKKGLIAQKKLYDGTTSVTCSEIGASLLPDIDIRVNSRNTPLCDFLPHMRKGNMPDGATPLTFTTSELNSFLNEYPDAKKFVRPLYGGDEFVNNNPKWVLWITDNDLNEALKIKGIEERIEKVRQTRAKSRSSQKSKDNPHKFRETNCTSPGKVSLIAPCVTSENREYFQMGILGPIAILNNNVSVIFDCDIWLLALLESKMHLVWAKNVGGGHEVRPRYSSTLCYNTFPVPDLSKKQISTLRNLSKTLLEVREKYCDKSLAEMYLHLPPELKRVHHWIDETVDSFYRNKPFSSDGERLIWLKNLYNKLTEHE